MPHEALQAWIEEAERVIEANTKWYVVFKEEIRGGTRREVPTGSAYGGKNGRH